jgi:acyl carrier protein
VKTTPEFNLAEKLTEEIRRMANNIQLTGVIEPNTDLLAAGILDSMGLIDLLNFMEMECGYRIDLLDADPAQLSTVMGLCELAAKSNGKAMEHGA